MYLRMLEETVQRVLRGDAGPSLQLADVSLDSPAHLPDDYIASPEAKLDLYRRLTRLTDPAAIEALQSEVRDRFGPLPQAAERFFLSALLRVVGGALGVEGIMVRSDEARITFRGNVVPRMKGLSAAFHGVQFKAEVRRPHPLSLKLTRLGGSEILSGLARALRSIS
jgi:transcription-repair coupling factor (superfamily II helicase)